MPNEHEKKNSPSRAGALPMPCFCLTSTYLLNVYTKSVFSIHVPYDPPGKAQPDVRGLRAGADRTGCLAEASGDGAGRATLVAYVSRFQIRPEERLLEWRFGEVYRQYAREVRRPV